ncbi:MAG: hypothetical protein OXC10_13690 [Rhodospirillaceae bacterium]|nr:hypothetical protein [Rhodospirillaceae bacterium]
MGDYPTGRAHCRQFRAYFQDQVWGSTQPLLYCTTPRSLLCTQVVTDWSSGMTAPWLAA